VTELRRELGMHRQRGSPSLAGSPLSSHRAEEDSTFRAVGEPHAGPHSPCLRVRHARPRTYFVAIPNFSLETANEP
jgi:hypothetical protein